MFLFRVGKSEASDGSDGEKSIAASLESDSRLQEAEEELSVLRDALQRAELRAETRALNVPAELEQILRKTYNVELSYFRSKRAAAERQLQTAKEGVLNRERIFFPFISPIKKQLFQKRFSSFFQCEKLYKKQQGVFGPFRVAHGSQLDSVGRRTGRGKVSRAGWFFFLEDSVTFFYLHERKIDLYYVFYY